MMRSGGGYDPDRLGPFKIRSGQLKIRSGGGRPPVGPWSGGGQGDLQRVFALAGAGFRVRAAVITPERGVPESGADLVVVVVGAGGAAGREGPERR
jgi:hypothetical protein